MATEVSQDEDMDNLHVHNSDAAGLSKHIPPPKDKDESRPVTSSAGEIREDDVDSRKEYAVSLVGFGHDDDVSASVADASVVETSPPEPDSEPGGADENLAFKTPAKSKPGNNSTDNKKSKETSSSPEKPKKSRTPSQKSGDSKPDSSSSGTILEPKTPKANDETSSAKKRRSSTGTPNSASKKKKVAELEGSVSCDRYPSSTFSYMFSCLHHYSSSAYRSRQWLNLLMTNKKSN